MSMADHISSANQETVVKVLGIPAKFIPQGTAEKILAQLGLDANGLAAAAREAL